MVADFGTNPVGAYDLIDRNGHVITTVSQAGFVTTLTGQGFSPPPPVTVTPATTQQVQFEQEVINQVFQTLTPTPPTSNPPSTNSPGSSTGTQSQPGNSPHPAAARRRLPSLRRRRRPRPYQRPRPAGPAAADNNAAGVEHALLDRRDHRQSEQSGELERRSRAGGE